MVEQALKGFEVYEVALAWHPMGVVEKDIADRPPNWRRSMKKIVARCMWSRGTKKTFMMQASSAQPVSSIQESCLQESCPGNVNDTHPCCSKHASLP